MVTTPTNEAGHGLPELPAPNKIAHDLLIDLRAAAAIGRPITGDEIHEIEQRMIATLALSRGVPDERIPSYAALLIIMQSVSGALERAGLTDCDDPGEAIDVIRERYEAKIAELTAAPAAAGAQGEDEIDRAARRMGDSARSLLQDIAQQATPQPAAADGGVRERARALFDAMLAAPYGSTTMGDIVCAETTCSRLESAWLPILEAALSSHRQAGDAVGEVGIEGNFIQYAIDDATGRPQEFAPGTKLYTAPPPGADLSILSDIAASMANFADVADACTITEGNAQTAIRAWRNQILALVEKGAGNG